MLIFYTNLITSLSQLLYETPYQYCRTRSVLIRTQFPLVHVSPVPYSTGTGSTMVQCHPLHLSSAPSTERDCERTSAGGTRCHHIAQMRRSYRIVRVSRRSTGCASEARFRCIRWAGCGGDSHLDGATSVYSYILHIGPVLGSKLMNESSTV